MGKLRSSGPDSLLTDDVLSQAVAARRLARWAAMSDAGRSRRIDRPTPKLVVAAACALFLAPWVVAAPNSPISSFEATALGGEKITDAKLIGQPTILIVTPSKAAAEDTTFDQCAEAYILAHKAGWKNAKHGDQWSNMLKTYVSPVFGYLPVAAIDTGLVVRSLAPIWESKTETASRVRGRIESVLGWATTSGYRAGENPARWKGHLENLLATISKTSRTKNHPSLAWPRIGAFMLALRMREGASARAVEFAILTACRSGEVRSTRWAEFDTTGKLWTIPAERMKGKREHQVPLSDAALAMLASMPKDNGDDVVFAGTRGQPLSDMSLTAVIRRLNGSDEPVWVDANGEGITVHGFRSSFRMWAAETTNYPREVAEHALAHQLPDAVERAYQRGSQFAKRAALMSEWAAYCATVLADARGTPIRKAVLSTGKLVSRLFCPTGKNPG